MCFSSLTTFLASIYAVLRYSKQVPIDQSVPSCRPFHDKGLQLGHALLKLLLPSILRVDSVICALNFDQDGFDTEFRKL